MLELIEQGELEVTQVAVATITGRYLTRVATMTELDRDELGQFLELGARLIYIKSAALLQSDSDEDAMSPTAELRQLNEELGEYRAMRQAASHLQRRLAGGQRSYARDVRTALEPSTLPPPKLELETLTRLFHEALKRARPEPQLFTPRINYDQAKIAASLLRSVSKRDIHFSKLLARCRDRIEIIVTFLVVLDLVRDGQVNVAQSSLFDDLMVSAA